ncbi:unnamed protein product [Pelagomonas calceolata]|uniref:SAM domain-containing protein n=1 Tax=Pelagomonas calceolata TaxID=35677 RepID=A0A8J2T261_9STRA|nr:unnamed protein product [Pelagomonas calceolata]
MEARLAALNLSHYAAALRGHEIDDDILKLMTVADLREAGLDPTAAQRLHADVSGVAAPPGLAPPPGFSAPSPRALAALGFDSATSQSAPMPLADAPPPGFQQRATGATTSPWGSRESSPRAAAEEPWSSRPPVLTHASTTSVAHDEDDDDDDAFAGFLPSDLLDDDDDDADAAVVARVAGASKAVADLDPKLRLAVQLVLAVAVVESIRRLVAIAGEALVALALGAGYVLYRRGRARAAPLPIVCAVLAGKARSAVDDSTFHAVIAQLLALLCAAACWWLATRPRKKRRRRPPVIKQKSADDWNVATGAASNAPKRKKKKGKTPRAKTPRAVAPAPEPAPKPEPEPEPEQPEQPEPEAAPRRRNQRSRQAPDPRLAAALFGGR